MNAIMRLIPRFHAKKWQIYLSAVFATFSAMGCDLCDCYAPNFEARNGEIQSVDLAGQNRGWFVAVSEQFTHFGTLQLDSHKVDNPTGQRLESSITQLVIGHRISDRFALQLNVPTVYRYYKRPEGFDIKRGTVSGLGDVSLLGRFLLFRTSALQSAGKNICPATQPDWAASAALLAGIKFPTGDSSRLKEEFNEEEVEGAPPSGIHGHDLALGSGSYDGVFGLQTSAQFKKLFFSADLQFGWRGQGRYSYRYANDFSWNGGPGYHFWQRPDSSLGLQLAVSGQTKGKDTFRGQPAEDTGMTALYVGPRLIGSRGRCSFELGQEWPVLLRNTSLQAVPDYRIRAGVAIQF